LLVKLKGAAEEWKSLLEDDADRSYTALRPRLLQRFGRSTLIKVAHVQVQIQNRMKKAGESWREYSEALRAIGHGYEVEEEWYVNSFAGGIAPEFGRAVRTVQPATLPRAVELVTIVSNSSGEGHHGGVADGPSGVTTGTKRASGAGEEPPPLRQRPARTALRAYVARPREPGSGETSDDNTIGGALSGQATALAEITKTLVTVQRAIVALEARVVAKGSDDGWRAQKPRDRERAERRTCFGCGTVGHIVANCPGRSRQRFEREAAEASGARSASRKHVSDEDDAAGKV
jgi:hypothetical protein